MIFKKGDRVWALAMSDWMMNGPAWFCPERKGQSHVMRYYHAWFNIDELPLQLHLAWLVWFKAYVHLRQDADEWPLWT